jgi:SAM-dependent methyltransferase
LPPADVNQPLDQLCRKLVIWSIIEQLTWHFGPTMQQHLTMRIARTGELPLSTDFEQITALLPTRDAHWLELGCGTALTTRRLAETFPSLRISAMEVDRIQHDRNRLIDDLPNVDFRFGGAQSIDLDDESVDAVIMLKSLHHVPMDAMADALTEIARVLRRGGLAYISEPVYAGPFNEILRLFNDEKVVREAAFNALRQCVESGQLDLHGEIHFNTKTSFQGFGEFEQRIIGATHSEFDIDDALHARIREAFSAHLDQEGQATFLSPLRLNLLHKR